MAPLSSTTSTALDCFTVHASVSPPCRSAPGSCWLIVKMSARADASG